MRKYGRRKSCRGRRAPRPPAPGTSSGAGGGAQPLVVAPAPSRQGDAHRGAGAELAVEADGSAMQLDELPGQVQPQPRAAILTRIRSVDLVEAIEDLAQMLRSDADAVVGDRDQEAA